jgi:hypothetical protein
MLSASKVYESVLRMSIRWLVEASTATPRTDRRQRFPFEPSLPWKEIFTNESVGGDGTQNGCLSFFLSEAFDL